MLSRTFMHSHLPHEKNRNDTLSPLSALFVNCEAGLFSPRFRRFHAIIQTLFEYHLLCRLPVDIAGNHDLQGTTGAASTTREWFYLYTMGVPTVCTGQNRNARQNCGRVCIHHSTVAGSLVEGLGRKEHVTGTLHCLQVF